MSNAKSPYSRGKWLAAAILAAGVIAALAEWKVSPPAQDDRLTPATVPALPTS